VLHRLAVGQHKDTRHRLTSIGLLLDRGYGKPPQAVELQANLSGDLAINQRYSAEFEELRQELDPDEIRALWNEMHAVRQKYLAIARARAAAHRGSVEGTGEQKQ
jgi:hypothetical protein